MLGHFQVKIIELNRFLARLPAHIIFPIRELRGSELSAYKREARIRRAMNRLHIRMFKSSRFIKKGPRVRLQEALTMHYIAQNTTIRVPRLLDAYTVNGVFHIVQERIDGPVLEDVWRRLSAEEQRRSMEQLKDCLDQLRTLKPPHPDRVQAIDGSSLFNPSIDADPWGPFDDHDAFHEFRCYDFLRTVPETYPRIQEALSKVHGRRYKTVFSHGDLGPHNVLWKNGHIFVIDWERSGWFPEYWDYTRVHMARGYFEDWWKMFEETVSRRYDDEMELSLQYSGYFYQS